MSGVCGWLADRKSGRSKRLCQESTHDPFCLPHSYDAANRTHTVTRADSSTVTTTAWLDGRPKSTTGTGVVPSYHTHGVETDGRRWHRVDTGTESSARWAKSWSDWLGRGIKTEHPGYTGQANVVAETFYGTNGLPSKTTRTGFSPTLFVYNYLNEVSRSGLDYNNNGSLELASSDRITESDTYLESYSSQWWIRTDTRIYPKLGLSTVVVTSTSRTRMTGHPTNRHSESQSIDAEGNVTTQVVDVNRFARTSTATTTRTGTAGSLVETTVNGFSTSVTSFDGLTAATIYDSLLRIGAVEDSRGNTTTTAYVPGTTLPQIVTNAAGHSAVTAYDNTGRVSWARDPHNAYSRFQYNARGQLLRQWGDGAMPVEYGYDSTYGDRTTMSTFRGGSDWDATTWPGSPGTADTTTFTYDGPSGLLTTKTDALTRAVSQTYNVRGQTAVRTLARGVTTTYGYDSATGELLTQTYSDSTPSVTYTYGRTGQVETVADFTGTRDLVYDSSKPWRLTAEAHDTFYGSRVLTRLYNESGIVGRVRGLQLGATAGSNADLEQIFGFTTVGRFETLATKRNANAHSRTFRYAYLANSALLQSVAIDQGAGPGGHPFTITRTYETHRDLVTSLDAKWSTASRTKYAYTHDERGQRSTVVQSGNVFADYGDVTSQQFTYNGRGELTGAFGHLGSDPTNAGKQLPGRQQGYAYDTAGNRLWSNRTGITELRDDYTTNALNQYVSRENNTIPVSGTAEPDPGGAGGVAVAVKPPTGTPVAAGRQGRYWNDEIAVPNVLNPWRGPITIFTAKRGSGGGGDIYRMDTRMAQVAEVLQEFTYDHDGNLTSDGLVDYQWDAENRLIRMETSSNAQTYNFPHRVIEFRYDYMGRRVQKRVIDADAVPAVDISYRRFLYDGWNLVAEFNLEPGTSNLSLVRSYTWGLDIVNTMASAGGVGALLQIADHASGRTFLPSYDGNGNVAALFNADTGEVAAAYEYSPYGEPLRAQSFDPVVADNPFRFSTKFTDVETGLVYYGHRYYEPRNGRFINRDPIEESGGLNLYGFVGNNPVNRWDYLGMEWSTTRDADGWTQIDFSMADDQGQDDIFASFSGYYSQEQLDALINEYGFRHSYSDLAMLDDGPRGNPQFGGGSLNLVVDGVAAGQIGGPELSEAMILAHQLDYPAVRVDIGPAKTINANVPSVATKEGATSANATKPNGDAPTAVAPNSAGSAIGNALRNIPLLGRVLGGAGDIVSGVVGTAAGVATLGRSGTLGSGLSNIGHGLGGVAMGGLDLVGKAWNAPNTAIGLAWGLAGVPLGARPVIRHNAIEFENHPLMLGGAITLGNTIHYAPDRLKFGPFDPLYEGSPHKVWEHEIQHTYQGQFLGPLYLPVHGIGMLGSLIKTGDTHKGNPHEGDIPWPRW